MTSRFPWREGIIALLVAVPAGIAGGAADHAWQQHRFDEARATYDAWQPAPPPAVPEQLEQALDDLAQHRVTVADDVTDLISAEDLAQARETLAGAEVPSYLMFVADPHTDDRGYRLDGVLSLMAEQVDEPAYLAVLTTRGDTASLGVGLQDGGYFFEAADGRPGNALKAVALHQAEEPPPPRREVGLHDAGDEGPVSGMAMGAVLGSLVLVPVWFYLDARWRRRSPRFVEKKKPSARGSGRKLP